MADIIQAAQKQIDDAAKEIKPDPSKSTILPPVPPELPPPTPEALMGKSSNLPLTPLLSEKTKSPAPVLTGPVIVTPGLPPEPPPAAAKDTDTISTQATAQLVDSLIHQKPVPYIPPPSSPLPPKVNAVPIIPPKPKKKGGKGNILLIPVIFLLLSLPVVIYFVAQQQRQLADIRSSATDTITDRTAACSKYSSGDMCSGNAGTYDGRCQKVTCPYGCNSNNQCGVGQPGATVSRGSCASMVASIGAGECAQVDPISSTNKYCLLSKSGLQPCGVVKVQCLDSCKKPQPPTNTPVPTETPVPGRPEMCVGASADKQSISTGESITFSSVAKADANKFSYMLYNMDNLYGPGNPKPVCVTSGGVLNDSPTYCPLGSHGLAFIDPDQATVRRQGKATVKYENVFLPDTNWGGQIPKNIQVNAYFMLNNGLVSLPNPSCVFWFSETTPECKNIRIFDNSGNEITATLAAGTSGTKSKDTVKIWVAGANAQKARVRVNSKSLDGTADWTIIDSSNKNAEGYFVETYVIPDIGQDTPFTVEAEISNDGIVYQ